MCLNALGLFGVPFVAFVGFILGIVAWATGRNALAADPADSRAKAGKTLGMIMTILGLVSVIVTILMMLGIIAAGMMA
jgi:protein-S-isoprenylcysteine O-methyltransferase Ste14